MDKNLQEKIRAGEFETDLIGDDRGKTVGYIVIL
jgi:hypothetical protein